MALKQLQQAAGDNAGGDALPRQQAETLLVLHQISWLFQGMRAILQLLGLLDAAAASNLKQEAAGLAIEVLRAAATADAAGKPGGSSAQARTSSSSHGSSAGSLTAAAVQLACTTAVLRLLSVPGQLSLPEGQARGLLGVLRGLAEQHAGLHGVLAGVLGGLGSEAVSGNREYEVRRRLQSVADTCAVEEGPSVNVLPCMHCCGVSALQQMVVGSATTRMLGRLTVQVHDSQTAAAP